MNKIGEIEQDIQNTFCIKTGHDERGVDWEVDTSSYNPVLFKVTNNNSGLRVGSAYYCKYPIICGYEVGDWQGINDELERLIQKCLNC